MYIPHIAIPMMIGVAVGLAFLAIMIARRQSAVITEPVCGSCGYCVRGIASLTCPECGSDLREVGIIAAGTRHTNKPRNAVVIWTLALPIPAALISWLLMITIMPYTQTQKVGRTIFCQSPALNTTLTATSIQRLTQPALLNHGFTAPEEFIVIDPTHGELAVNLKTGAYHTIMPGGSSTSANSGFSPTVIANWFARPSVSASDPRIINLAQSVFGSIAEIPTNLNTSTFTPFRDPAGVQIGIAHPAFAFTVLDEPSPWVIVGLAIFWLLIWLLGVRRIHRRRAAVVSAV